MENKTERATLTFDADGEETLSDIQGENQFPLAGIPDFEAIEHIASGGTGSVFRARQLSLERPVALKVPRGLLMANEEARRRFLVEARAAARLDHPNICTIHEVGEYAGRAYIVMAYVDGDSLAELLAAKAIPPKRGIAIIEELAKAVAFAHDKGVVHRDLKPHNVMIDEHSGAPVLTDFGLAKLNDEESILTREGEVMGTPAYMSPEQAAGCTDDIGPATDVYSLGAMLYELLCGKPPFVGKPMSVINQICSTDPVAPRKVAPTVHRDLETICLRALAKLPRDRYESAAELAADLHRFQAGEAILARPDSLASKIVRKARRNVTVMLILAAAIVAVASIAWLAFGEHGDRGRIRLAAGAIEQEFEDRDWSEGKLSRIDILLADLRALSGEEADKLAARTQELFIADIRQRIRAQTLQQADIAEIEAWLEVLAVPDRAPVVAEELSAILRERLEQWQPVLEVALP